jgi:hypothetical protein
MLRYIKQILKPSISKGFILSLAGLYWFKSKQSLDFSLIIKCQDIKTIKFTKYRAYSPAEIVIVYDPANKLQVELVDIVRNKLTRMLNKLPRDFLTIHQVEYNSLEESAANKYKELPNSNEPFISIKIGLVSWKFNALSFTSDKNTLNLKEKLKNVLYYQDCENMVELRDTFKYLDHPRHSIILLSDEITEANDKLLSLYRSKYTKIVHVTDKNLKEQLRLKDNHFYIYYSPKLPNNMKNTELFIKDQLDEGTFSVI